MPNPPYQPPALIPDKRPQQQILRPEAEDVRVSHIADYNEVIAKAEQAILQLEQRALRQLDVIVKTSSEPRTSNMSSGRVQKSTSANTAEKLSDSRGNISLNSTTDKIHRTYPPLPVPERRTSRNMQVETETMRRIMKEAMSPQSNCSSNSGRSEFRMSTPQRIIERPSANVTWMKPANPVVPYGKTTPSQTFSTPVAVRSGSMEHVIIIPNVFQNSMAYSFTPQGATSITGSQTEKCNTCGIRKPMFVCSICQSVWYCSKQCQVNDWVDHNRRCNPSNQQYRY